jgi:hypothetical protein
MLLSDRDRRLLAELLWIPRDDPRRDRILREEPHLADRLAELEAAHETAERAYRHLFASRIEQDLATAPVDEAFERATMAALDRERTAAKERADARFPAARARAWTWALGAAVVAAAIAVAVRPFFQDSERDPVWLSGSASTSASPIGRVDGWDTFRWSPGPPPGSVHIVRVRRHDGAQGEVELESPPLTSPQWSRPADFDTRIGADFTWSVVEQDPVTGELRRLFEARVERSR